MQDAVRNGAQPVFTYYRDNAGGVEAFEPSTVAGRAAVVTVAIWLT